MGDTRPWSPNGMDSVCNLLENSQGGDAAEICALLSGEALTI